MNKARGKNKGSAWERLLAKRLSLWWTAEDLSPRDNVFWRTSNSGGRATVRSKSGLVANRQCGDLCAIDPIGEPLLKVISWELKKGYGRCTIHDLLDKPENAKDQMLEQWIAQASSDQIRSGARYWCIVHQRDRREPLIITTQAFIVALDKYIGFPSGWPRPAATLDGPGMFSHQRLCVCQFSEFLKTVRKRHILSLLE